MAPSKCAQAEPCSGTFPTPSTRSHTRPFLSPELGSSLRGEDFTQSGLGQSFVLKSSSGPRPSPKKHFTAPRPRSLAFEQ